MKTNLTDQQLIDRIAVEVMGWEQCRRSRISTSGISFTTWDWGIDGEFKAAATWNPIQDTNHHAEAVAHLGQKTLYRIAANPLHDAELSDGLSSWFLRFHLTEEGRRAFWTAWAER